MQEHGIQKRTKSIRKFQAVLFVSEIVLTFVYARVFFSEEDLGIVFLDLSTIIIDSARYILRTSMAGEGERKAGKCSGKC